MNFEEWYEHNGESLDKREMREAWEACRDEILKFIREPSDYYCSYVEEIASHIKTL